MFENELDWLRANLKVAGMNVEAERYAEQALKAAALVGLLVWFVGSIASAKMASGLLYAFLSMVLALGVFLYLPVLKKKELAGQVEKDLPFALMQVSVELNMNVPFEKTLESIETGSYGLLAREFRKVLREIRESGASIQEALFHLSERIDSSMLKRAVSQLVSVYEQGSRNKNGEPIRQLAKELLLKQKAESKEFSGKLVVFSLLFIAVSAIIPAFFQAYVVIGSMFLKMKFTAAQILVIALVLFPAVDLAVLAVIKAKTPAFMRE